MANCLLAYPDFVQPTGYQTPVLSGGSWSADLPLDNLQDPALATLARTSDDLEASTVVDIDLQIGRPIRLVTLSKHNISNVGQIRITASANSDYSSPDYQTGWIDAWPTFYPFGSLPWGYPGVWSGVLANEETDGYTMQVVHALSSAVWSRYWRIEISDESNPDGYIELARASVWAAWQPDQNMDYGASLGWETDTPSERSLSGVDYFDRRDPRRVAQFRLNQIDIDTALLKPFEMIRKLGKDGQLFFVFDPDDDQSEMFKRAFLATMRELSPLEYPGYNHCAQVFAIQEVL